MMGTTNGAENPGRFLREGAAGQKSESKHNPDEGRLLDREASTLPTPTTVPHTPLRHILEGHDQRDRRDIPAPGPREDAPHTNRTNQIGVQQPQRNWDIAYSPHSDRSPGSAKTRFYLLDTESSAPHSRKTILWSIDVEHLTYNNWLIENFVKFIQSFHPPPARIGKYTLNFIVMDREFPNENYLQMLPREFVSYLVKEPYNPAVEFQGGKYGHVLALPILNMGSGRMGKRIRVVYMVEYDPLAFEKPRTSQYDWGLHENDTPALPPAPVQFQHPQHSQALECPEAVQDHSVHKSHKYVAVITVHILPRDDRLEKMVLRPPFDIDVEEQGNFSELYAKVEALISDAYAVSPHGRLSEVVNSRAVDVHLAYNTFVLPRHFAWNEKSFTEVDPQENGGVWKLHLIAWIVEHPLGDPGGAPTGLPLSRSKFGWWVNGWVPPTPLDLCEWKSGGNDTSSPRGSRKGKVPDRGPRPSSPSQRGEYCTLRGGIRSEPGPYMPTPRETYQPQPRISREPLPPLRPIEAESGHRERRAQEVQSMQFHESQGRIRGLDWSYRQAYAEEHREDENERRSVESNREGFYVKRNPVRNHGPGHGIWRHNLEASEHKPEIDDQQPGSAGSVASGHSSSQGYSSRGVPEHHPAEGLHMEQSGRGPGEHPGAQEFKPTVQHAQGCDTNQPEVCSSPVKRKREG